MATSWIAGSSAGEAFADIRYEKSAAPEQGIAKITIARPEVRNAFRPRTVIEISRALEDAREDTAIGAIVLTGEGSEAFCSGGDQRVRGDSGYLAEDQVGSSTVGRFHVTDLHVQIRRLPKPVVAMVAGYAIGGGHVLHLVCDLTIAADNARFGQVGPRVGSFDGGFGAGLLARLVGPKKAKEIWFLCRRYSAPELVGTALALGAGHFDALAFVAALLGAMLIQVGTNLSNDYSDARRGADTEDRLGPVRVTAGGLLPPSQVLLATWVTFGLAVACGAYLVAVAGPELLAVGAASILAGVLYTGGPRPYGYEGLGEVFVFLFFGIVAVAGSYFVQVQELPWEAFVCAVPVGLLASAILVVNNIRDLETDRRAGKRTLAVRLGRERTRGLYAAMLAGAYLAAPLPWLLGSMSAWLLLSWG